MAVVVEDNNNTLCFATFHFVCGGHPVVYHRSTSSTEKQPCTGRGPPAPHHLPIIVVCVMKTRVVNDDGLLPVFTSFRLEPFLFYRFSLSLFPTQPARI